MKMSWTRLLIRCRSSPASASCPLSSTAPVLRSVPLPLIIRCRSFALILKLLRVVADERRPEGCRREVRLHQRSAHHHAARAQDRHRAVPQAEPQARGGAGETRHARSPHCRWFAFSFAFSALVFVLFVSRCALFDDLVLLRVAGVFEAKFQDRETLGFVGQVTRVDHAPIKSAMDAGCLPIVSCMGATADGQVCFIVYDFCCLRLVCSLLVVGCWCCV